VPYLVGDIYPCTGSCYSAVPALSDGAITADQRHHCCAGTNEARVPNYHNAYMFKTWNRGDSSVFLILVGYECYRRTKILSWVDVYSFTEFISDMNSRAAKTKRTTSTRHGLLLGNAFVRL
jgi:hypothetical protein